MDTYRKTFYHTIQTFNHPEKKGLFENTEGKGEHAGNFRLQRIELTPRACVSVTKLGVDP